MNQIMPRKVLIHKNIYGSGIYGDDYYGSTEVLIKEDWSWKPAEINDWGHLLKKRVIDQVFINKTAGYIFGWIITNILYDEGITALTIQDGPTFGKVVFNYKSVMEAFNYLQEACIGYNWNINKYKQIDFVSKLSNKSTTVINDTFFHRNL
jgi:hypothetical protein